MRPKICTLSTNTSYELLSSIKDICFVPYTLKVDTEFPSFRVFRISLVITITT